VHGRQEVRHILDDGDAEGVYAIQARLDPPPTGGESGGESATNRGL
jgi:hypothetical protein